MIINNKLRKENIFKFIIIYLTFSLINKTNILEIDNIIKEPLFQNDINFFPFDTEYK